jgi:ubiquinone/menaquinone biosynthesis C-methylase UbiE
MKDADRMPDLAFRVMTALFALEDLFFPRLDRRVAKFDLQPDMTVVDYGCGPGRYTVRFARLVGPGGLVYAVDVQELALDAVRRKMRARDLKNIVPVLAKGYRTEIPESVADRAFALDMIFMVRDPSTLLAEIHRILRPDGVLILDDGHQRRSKTHAMVNQSGLWRIQEETKDHLRCIPVAD